MPSNTCNFCGSDQFEVGSPTNFCSTQCQSFYMEEAKDHRSFCVGAYNCDQAYGGPEEGGWYFNTGSLVKTCRTFPTLRQALIYMRRLNLRLRSRKFGPNTGRRGMYSAASDGEIVAYVYGTTCPKSFPEKTPRYE